MAEVRITTLIKNVIAGLPGADQDLMQVVYDELHEIAARMMRRERKNHSLQPTELINELWIKLAQDSFPSVSDRTHFMRLAAGMMRRVLVDHARAKGAARRGGEMQLVSLDPEHGATPVSPSILELEEQLECLSQIDPRQALILELRYFGGLEISDIASLQGLSEATVYRELNQARTWLHGRLKSHH